MNIEKQFAKIKLNAYLNQTSNIGLGCIYDYDSDEECDDECDKECDKNDMNDRHALEILIEILGDDDQ